jgi:hypothetical protein
MSISLLRNAMRGLMNASLVLFKIPHIRRAYQKLCIRSVSLPQEDPLKMPTLTIYRALVACNDTYPQTCADACNPTFTYADAHFPTVTRTSTLFVDNSKLYVYMYI